jgi:tRNA threonylcarbamoyladenosine modification (KEOPS) complex Cgi121 subunit
MNYTSHEISEQITDFINEHSLNEGDYFIIVSELNDEKHIRFAYKSLDDFQKNYDEHIKQIDEYSGIKVEWFSFD